MCGFLQEHTVCKDNRAVVVVPEEDVSELQGHVEKLYTIAAISGTGHKVDAIVDHYSNRYLRALDQDDCAQLPLVQAYSV